MLFFKIKLNLCNNWTFLIDSIIILCIVILLQHAKHFAFSYIIYRATINEDLFNFYSSLLSALEEKSSCALSRICWIVGCSQICNIFIKRMSFIKDVSFHWAYSLKNILHKILGSINVFQFLKTILIKCLYEFSRHGLTLIVFVWVWCLIFDLIILKFTSACGFPVPTQFRLWVTEALNCRLYKVKNNKRGRHSRWRI